MQDLIFGEYGIEIIKWLQTISTSLDFIFQTITLLGGTYFFIVVIIVIYWNISKSIGVHLAFISLFSSWLVGFTKGLIGLERPYITYPSDIRQISSGSNYSFYSGHSSATGTFWGFLIFWYRDYRDSKKIIRLLLPIGLILLILVPLSRVYLGVHYPSDVIVGASVGLVLSFFYVKYHQSIEKTILEFSTSTQVISAFIISLILLIITTGTTIIAGNDLREASNGTMPGVFLGLSLGIIVESKYIKFNIKPSQNWMYLLRLILGLVVVSIPYLIIGSLLSDFKDSDLEFIRDYIRFSFVAFFAFAIAPYLFSQSEKKLFLQSNSIEKNLDSKF